MQYCRIVSLDNNNSVKFTSSRGDNYTTNHSMVMKVTHAQLHMNTNIMFKFQRSTCKTVGEKLWTKLCSLTDRQMDGQPWRFQYTPSNSLWGGGGYKNLLLNTGPRLCIDKGGTAGYQLCFLCYSSVGVLQVLMLFIFWCNKIKSNP